MQIPLQAATSELVHVILFSASLGTGGWWTVQLEASWVPPPPRGGHGRFPRLWEASEVLGDCKWVPRDVGWMLCFHGIFNNLILLSRQRKHLKYFKVFFRQYMGALNKTFTHAGEATGPLPLHSLPLVIKTSSCLSASAQPPSLCVPLNTCH